MTSSEDLDAAAAKRGHASHQNRLAFVEDLARPSKTAVSSRSLAMAARYSMLAE